MTTTEKNFYKQCTVLANNILNSDASVTDFSSEIHEINTTIRGSGFSSEALAHYQLVQIAFAYKFQSFKDVENAIAAVRTTSPTILGKLRRIYTKSVVKNTETSVSPTNYPSKWRTFIKNIEFPVNIQRKTPTRPEEFRQFLINNPQRLSRKEMQKWADKLKCKYFDARAYSERLLKQIENHQVPTTPSSILDQLVRLPPTQSPVTSEHIKEIEVVEIDCQEENKTTEQDTPEPCEVTKTVAEEVANQSPKYPPPPEWPSHYFYATTSQELDMLNPNSANYDPMSIINAWPHNPKHEIVLPSYFDFSCSRLPFSRCHICQNCIRSENMGYDFLSFAASLNESHQV